MKVPDKKLERSEQAERVRVKLEEFLKSNNAALVPALTFPLYNRLPIELELAKQIITKHEPEFIVDITILDKKEK